MNEREHSSASVSLGDPVEIVLGRSQLGAARLDAAITHNLKSLGFWSRKPHV